MSPSTGTTYTAGDGTTPFLRALAHQPFHYTLAPSASKTSVSPSAYPPSSFSSTQVNDNYRPLGSITAR